MHKVIRNVLLASSLSVLLVAANEALAAAHYVNSSTGTTSGTGTVSSPWKTLAQANAHTFVAGDSLNVNGTFTGQTLSPILPGTSTSGITVLGHDTGGSSGYAVMQSVYLSKATYATFSNMNVGWSSTVTATACPTFHGILLQATSQNLTFTNMQVHDTVEGIAINDANCNNITVNNVSIKRTGANGMVYGDPIGDHVHVNGGSITYTGIHPQNTGYTHGVYASGGHSHEWNNVTFAHNLMGANISLRRGTMIVSGCTFNGTPDSENGTWFGHTHTNKMLNWNNEDDLNEGRIIRIYRNTFIGGSTAASMVAFYFGLCNTGDTTVEVSSDWFVWYNNNFINSYVNAGANYQESYYFYWRNNLFYNTTLTGEVATSGVTHTYSNNAWWGTYVKPADYNGASTELIANPVLSSNAVTSTAYRNVGVATIVSSPLITVTYSGTAPDIGRQEY